LWLNYIKNTRINKWRIAQKSGSIFVQIIDKQKSCDYHAQKTNPDAKSVESNRRCVLWIVFANFTLLRTLFVGYICFYRVWKFFYFFLKFSVDNLELVCHNTDINKDSWLKKPTTEFPADSSPSLSAGEQNSSSLTSGRRFSPNLRSSSLFRGFFQKRPWLPRRTFLELVLTPDSTQRYISG